MEQELFNFLTNIPQTIAGFMTWLNTPIGNGINISPLALFSAGGVGIIITIIAVHVVQLFNPF